MDTPTGAKRALVKPAFWVSTLYFAEGLPFSVVRLMSSAFFKAYGLSNSAIGLFSAVGLAWTLKLFWSPLVDLYSTRRRWVLVSQALLVGAGTLLALAPNLPAPITVAMVCMVVIALLSATQDIAIDGYYLEALEGDDQARYAGLRVAAYRVAMITASGALVALAGIAGWSAGFGGAAALMGLVWLFHSHALPRTDEQDAGEDTPGARGPGGFGEAFASFVRQPRIALMLLFMLLYKQGDALLFAMNTPFLMDLGVTVAELGLIAGTIGKVASIAGSILGGMWMARAGVKRGVWTLSFAMNVPILLYVWLAHIAEDGGSPGLIAIAAVHSAEQFAAGLGTAAYMVFLMRTCSSTFRAAHYAIATGVMALGMTGAGVVSGYLTERFGYVDFFWICFAATLPGLLMMWFLPFGRMAADVEEQE